MQFNTIKTVRSWRMLLLLAIMPALISCKQKFDVQVELRASSGNLYSFEGATVELYELNSAAATPGQTRTVLASGKVKKDDGLGSIKIKRSLIEDNKLYGVEFKCPPNNAEDACEVETPIHATVSGTQLKTEDWKATVLTEVTYQNIAYYVAVAYPADDITQVLNNNAAWLLMSQPPSTAPTYEDLLAWNPTNTTAVQRASLLPTVVEALVEGTTNNTIKLLAQQWISPFVGSLNLEGYVSDVAVAGQYAYLVQPDFDGDEAFRVVDISDPRQPLLKASLSALVDMRSVVVAGDYAYVTEVVGYLFNTHGALQIVNVSVPEQPAIVGRFDTPGYASDVAFGGGYAYVAEYYQVAGEGFNGLQIINITYPQQPVLAGSLPTDAALTNVALSGNYVYATGGGGLFTIDISNPAVPVVVGNLEASGGLGVFALSGGYVYAAGYNGVLQIIDIGDPTAPTLVGNLELWRPTFASNSLRSIKVVGDVVYVGDDYRGMSIIDVSNPATPQLIGNLGTPTYSDAVILPGGYAYLATGGEGLQVFDTNVLERPAVLSGSLAVAGGVRGDVAAANGYAYMTAVDDGFTVFDLTEPLQPEFLTLNTERPFLNTVALSGQYAFVGDASNGALRVVDISNPAEPIVLDGAAYPDEEELFGLNTVALAGNNAYMSFGYTVEDPDTLEDIDVGVVFVVDIQDPTTPTIVSHINLAGKAGAMAVDEDHAYVMVSGTQLQIIDTGDPLQPTLAGSLTLASATSNLTVSGNDLYAAQGAAGIQIINVSDPATPTLTASLDTAGSANAVALSGRYAYVADGISGIITVDVSSLTAPIVVGYADTLGSVFTTFLSGGCLFGECLFGGTGYGIEVLKPIPATAN